jgi:hypothetical protein
MPNTQDAIPGVYSKDRKRKKLRRQAKEAFPSMPNYLKTWTPDQADAYIDNLDVSNPIALKEFLKKQNRVLILYRDIFELFEEES